MTVDIIDASGKAFVGLVCAAGVGTVIGGGMEAVKLAEFHTGRPLTARDVIDAPIRLAGAAEDALLAAIRFAVATVDSIHVSPVTDLSLNLQRQKQWEKASIVRAWEIPTWRERVDSTNSGGLAASFSSTGAGRTTAG